MSERVSADEARRLRERVARALYDHAPLYQRQPGNALQKRTWLNLWAQEQAPFLAQADAVLAVLAATVERLEADIQQLRAALTKLAEWDMLTLTAEGHGAATADAPWARAVIDAALSAEGDTRWMVDLVTRADRHEYQSRAHDCDIERCIAATSVEGDTSE